MPRDWLDVQLNFVWHNSPSKLFPFLCHKVQTSLGVIRSGDAILTEGKRQAIRRGPRERGTRPGLSPARYVREPGTVDGRECRHGCYLATECLRQLAASPTSPAVGEADRRSQKRSAHSWFVERIRGKARKLIAPLGVAGLLSQKKSPSWWAGLVPTSSPVPTSTKNKQHNDDDEECRGVHVVLPWRARPRGRVPHIEEAPDFTPAGAFQNGGSALDGARRGTQLTEPF